MNIKQMTTQHIKNRIAYLKRFLDTRPPEAIYGGNSEAAEDAVEQENRQNEALEQNVQEHIEKLEKELTNR